MRSFYPEKDRPQIKTIRNGRFSGPVFIKGTRIRDKSGIDATVNSSANSPDSFPLRQPPRMYLEHGQLQEAEVK
jgi:hypothetical protein